MIDFAKLKEPFYPDELEWKPQSAGKKNGRLWVKALAYVTNRAIMDRLDSVIGPSLWKNEYAKGPENGVICGISIKIEGEWITKWDGAENTDIEAVKGGLSGAMKRAAVQWGIGRYLYDLEETFGEVTEAGIFSAKTKQADGGEYFRWNPPALPAWAIPGSVEKKVRQPMPPRESPPEVKTSKKMEVTDWLNEHFTEIKALPELEKSLRVKLAEAGEDSAKLDAVLADAKKVLGIV